MKKEVMKKWVKALHSGKFKQGADYLNNSDTHCCLGVLCEIAKEEGIEVNSKGSTILGDSLGDQHHVQSWAGIKTAVGDLPQKVKDSDGDRTHLAALNDQGKSFKQIARIIQKHWRYL